MGIAVAKQNRNGWNVPVMRVKALVSLTLNFIGYLSLQASKKKPIDLAASHCKIIIQLRSAKLKRSAVGAPGLAAAEKYL